MRYGIPYKGSKNSIAEWIIAELPRADIFVDLFFGGGAITHAGMLSGKWHKFIVNDIDARLPKLFIDCAYGKYTVENHPDWVTREEFNARKKDDAYIALVWSFGNNGKDYLYGADIEDMKYAYHRAVYEGDIKALEPFGYKLSLATEKGVYERYLNYQRQIKKQTPNIQLEVVTRQTEIERLQSLQSLQSHGTDYRKVPIPDGALIYCDIPYRGTNCGKYDGFNHAEFYEWAKHQDNIYISEYSMPAEDFIQIARINKRQLSTTNGASDLVEEKLFTNHKTYYKLSKERQRIAMLNMAEQSTIFDFIAEGSDEE